MKYKLEDITNADWVSIMAIALIIISGCLFTYYYTTKEINDCTSNPLQFAAQSAVDKNITYNYVELKVYKNKHDIVPLQTIEIDLKPFQGNLPNLSRF